MAWDWKTIEADWLVKGRVALSPEQVVAAFERVERVLGREWIERAKGGASGSMPTLFVAGTGLELRALEQSTVPDLFIEKLRRGDVATHAELAVLHMLVGNDASVVAEVQDERSFPMGVPVSDMRARPVDRDEWVYVEVSRPDASDLRIRAGALIDRVASLVERIPETFGLEVFLRREPDADEEERITREVVDLCRVKGRHVRDLPGLGLLLLNASPPDQVVFEDHGDPVVPRVGVVKLVSADGRVGRIVVRMPFSDDRAEKVLKREAAQLPNDAPGVVIIDIANATGSLRTWGPLIERRFQPSLFTRVGAVCLFSSGQGTDVHGRETWVRETKIIANPHARYPVPGWAMERLASWASS